MQKEQHKAERSRFGEAAEGSHKRNAITYGSHTREADVQSSSEGNHVRCSGTEKRSRPGVFHWWVLATSRF